MVSTINTIRRTATKTVKIKKKSKSRRGTVDPACKRPVYAPRSRTAPGR